LGHLRAQGRKRATLAAVESTFRVWLDPQLGDRALDGITPEDVEDLMRAMTAAKVGGKSIRNYIGTLSALYRFAMHPRRRWATTNPVDAIDLPPIETTTEIHYLTVTEVEALASAAVAGEHQALDRALYVTAAMTGLRQGELIALRWSDVDWTAQRIRVRRTYVLGEFDTPKSRRSPRATAFRRQSPGPPSGDRGGSTLMPMVDHLRRSALSATGGLRERPPGLVVHRAQVGRDELAVVGLARGGAGPSSR